MTTKKKRAPLWAASSPLQRYFWLGLKVVGSVSFLFFVFAILRIQSQNGQQSLTSSAVAAAKAKASAAAAAAVLFTGPPKIAFLFLARTNLPLDFLWNAFFQNGDEGNFSVYVHSEPGFVFDKTTTRSPFFYGRQLAKSVQVVWGESSMIEAERLLLQAALEDPANQRFVLLSDSCVPLYNFSYAYNYMMSSSKSFVDSFLDAKGGRYNPKMAHSIPEEKWRKGSQWITLVRKHAMIVVIDDAIYPIFKRFCKRRPAIDFAEKRKTKLIIQKEHNCIPDEHYMQTLFSMCELDDEVECRTLTYTSWDESKNAMETQRWHPITFEYDNASPQHIKKIKEINHVYYATEYRTEWCQNNATSVPCFLFARKFSRGAAMRLLSEGVVGAFDASALLLMSL